MNARNTYACKSRGIARAYLRAAGIDAQVCDEYIKQEGVAFIVALDSSNNPIQLPMEEIMKVYSTKAAAKKGLGRMGGDAGQFDALVTQVGDEWHLDDSKLTAPVRSDARSKTPSAEQAEAVTKHFDNRPKVKVEKTFAEERAIGMKKGAKAKPAVAPKVKRPIIIKDAGEKAPRMSVKGQLRALFAKRKTYDEAEVLSVTQATQSALDTALSDLRNPKYAGGDVLALVRDKETRVIRKVDHA